MVANRIAEGFAAVLTEPYSADSLAEVTKLALALRNQQRARYEQRVVRLLVREICDQIDATAKLRLAKRPASLSMYLLSEMCEILPTLTAEMQELYFSELMEITSRAKPFQKRSEKETPAEISNQDEVPLKRIVGAL